MTHRFRRDAGIAIGPILFVIALLGVLAAYFASDNSSSLSGAAREDTITSVIHNQANLIRQKFHQCNMMSTDNTWPVGDGTGTAVGDVECPAFPSGRQNLWVGAYAAQLPRPPNGFPDWRYYDYSATGGGRCVRVVPTSVDNQVRNGLKRAAAKFTSLEIAYDENGSAQNFVVWVTRPTGSAGANCEAG